MNSEAFPTCNQHVNFTFMHSPEFHACVSYMGRYPLMLWGNDAHVWAVKKNFKSFSTCSEHAFFTWAAAEMYYQNSCRSRFSGVYLGFEVFQDAWRSNKEILVYPGMLPCLVPSWSQIMQIRISFRSRSDLVLDADHVLDLLRYLVLQASISFCSV